MTDNAAGWQPDPTGKHDHRYWDGSQWTDNVADAGVAGTDPYEDVAAADAAPAEPEVPAAEEPTVVQPVASADPTAAFPAATAPAAPPPYVPPSPVAGGDGPAGGNKRGLLVGGAILAAVALAVVAFLALGGDDDDVRAQLATAMRNDEDFDLSGGQADCIADLIVDEAGEDTFKDTDFDAEDPPPEFIAAVLAVGEERFVEECGIDESAFGGTTDSSDGSTDGSTDGGDADLEDLRDSCADGDFSACDDLYFSADFGSDLEEFGSTCGGIADPQSGSCESTNGGEDGFTTGGFGTDDMESIIADTYEEIFGISREKAECLAGKMSEAIENGDLTEEQAMTEIFDYLADCDISMEEISGN